MEQKRLKPFVFPQDVRLVVFGTKLFKVKVMFRGGQLREEDQALCAKDRITQNELKLVLSQFLHCLSEAKTLRPIQSTRMMAYPMLAYWQAQSILEFYHNEVQLSPYRCSLTLFVELKRGEPLVEREDEGLCTPANQVIPRKRGAASPLRANRASPPKRQNNRQDDVPDRSASGSHRHHKQTHRPNHNGRQQQAMLPTEQAVVPGEVAEEEGGSVVFETAESDASAGEVTLQGHHGNTINGEQEGHAKTGVWSKLWTGVRAMFGY